MAYNTAYDLDSLMVNTKAATVYTAHESSLFLGGALIPMVNLPAGSYAAQIPVMGSVVAEKLTSADPDALDDFTALTVTDSKVTVEANIYAARHVLRDLGGIDPQETGRVLGNAIQAKFDADVAAALESTGITQTVDTDGTLNMDLLFDAVATIRGNGETGQLFAVISPAAAAALMKDIGSSAFAGGDYQTEALRNGFVARAAGINIFQSSYMTNEGAVFGADAFRIAMFKNVDLEVQRRAAAVGNDIVASLHAGVGLINAPRAVRLLNVA
jgi:hypothetical protein